MRRRGSDLDVMWWGAKVIIILWLSLTVISCASLGLTHIIYKVCQRAEPDSPACRAVAWMLEPPGH